jgi:hypothetical protein
VQIKVDRRSSCPSCGNLYQILQRHWDNSRGISLVPWWFLTPLETKIRIMPWGKEHGL